MHNVFLKKIAKIGCPCRNIFQAGSVSGVLQGELLCAILFYYRKLYMQILCYCKCLVAFPHGAVRLSSVCDCGIS